MNKKKIGGEKIFNQRYISPHKRIIRLSRREELEKNLKNFSPRNITFFHSEYEYKKDKNIQNIVNIYKKRYGGTKDMKELKKLSYHYKDDKDFPEFISTRRNLYSNNFEDEYKRRIDKINQFIQRRIEDYENCYSKLPQYKEVFNRYKELNNNLRLKKKNTRVKEFCKSSIPWDENINKRKNCNNIKDFNFLRVNEKGKRIDNYDLIVLGFGPSIDGYKKCNNFLRLGGIYEPNNSCSPFLNWSILFNQLYDSCIWVRGLEYLFPAILILPDKFRENYQGTKYGIPYKLTNEDFLGILVVPISNQDNLLRKRFLYFYRKENGEILVLDKDNYLLNKYGRYSLFKQRNVTYDEINILTVWFQFKIYQILKDDNGNDISDEGHYALSLHDVDNDYIYNLIEKGIIVKIERIRQHFKLYLEGNNYYHKMRPSTVGKNELNEYRTNLVQMPNWETMKGGSKIRKSLFEKLTNGNKYIVTLNNKKYNIYSKNSKQAVEYIYKNKYGGYKNKIIYVTNNKKKEKYECYSKNKNKFAKLI